MRSCDAACFYDVFCAFRRGAEFGDIAVHRRCGRDLCGAARDGKNGGRMVWRHRYEGGPQCAPLAWPGAHTAGGRCHGPYRGGAADRTAICRGRARRGAVRHADL